MPGRQPVLHERRMYVFKTMPTFTSYILSPAPAGLFFGCLSDTPREIPAGSNPPCRLKEKPAVPHNNLTNKTKKTNKKNKKKA